MLKKMEDRFEKHVYLFISKDDKKMKRQRLKLTAEEAYNFSQLR
jgi:hypothetical protein